MSNTDICPICTRPVPYLITEYIHNSKVFRTARASIDCSLTSSSSPRCQKCLLLLISQIKTSVSDIHDENGKLIEPVAKIMLTSDPIYPTKDGYYIKYRPLQGELTKGMVLYHHHVKVGIVDVISGSKNSMTLHIVPANESSVTLTLKNETLNAYITKL